MMNNHRNDDNGSAQHGPTTDREIDLFYGNALGDPVPAIDSEMQPADHQQ